MERLQLGKLDSYQTPKWFQAGLVGISFWFGCAAFAQNPEWFECAAFAQIPEPPSSTQKPLSQIPEPPAANSSDQKPLIEQSNGGMGKIFSPAVRDEELQNPQVKELFAQSVQLLKTNRAYQARELLERALVLAPNSASIHCNLGLAYQNSGNMTRALTEFKTALGLNPQMPEAILNLAGCYQSIGANHDAIRYYNAYLTNPQLNPRQRKQVADIVSALQSASTKPDADPQTENYLPSVTADGAFRWPMDKLPIRVYVQNAIVDKSGNQVGAFKQEFQTALIKSFDEWCKATNGRIDFRTVPDKEHADIFCTWTVDPSDVAENGTLSERGSAKVMVKGDNIERATLKILVRPILDEGSLSKDELMKACLHEVGHVLGLQGHSTNNHDVMFSTVDTSTVWPVLSRRDKSTINKLYASYPVAAKGANHR